MIVYRPDTTELDFDFFSTEPTVDSIITRVRSGRNGGFATAVFRYSSEDAQLESLTCWGETEDKAIERLLEELRTRYIVSVVPSLRTIPIRTAKEAIEKINKERERKSQQRAPIGRTVRAGRKLGSKLVDTGEEYGE